MDSGEPRPRSAQRLGFWAGPLLAALAYAALPDTYAAPDGEPIPFAHAGRVTAAVAVWMGTWWLSEAIPIYATALLPLAALPLLGAASMREAAAPYAHELIFLFMGGFLLALAMQRWGLHRRIALLALRVVGERPAHMVGGFMVITALLSMWVSNTATAMLMLPVALSVIDRVARQTGAADTPTALADPDSAVRPFALALLLGVAYAASIGGLGTPIGTPPNLFLLSYLETNLGREISFVGWMLAVLPLVAVFLPLTWLLLTRVLHPIPLERVEGGAALLAGQLAELGPPNRGERIVFGVFVCTAALWITRPLLARFDALSGLSDSGIAVLAALALFVAPVDRRAGRFVLDWETAVKLPWGILVLFGGGLSLAAAIQDNGVAELLGAWVVGFPELSPLLLLLVVVTLIVFLTELTSNTATAAALIPVLAAVAPGFGIAPLALAFPAALAASCAFMLPVATPPNAVIFGSGLVGVRDMVRTGFWLNWIGIGLVILFSRTVSLPLLGE